MNIPTFEYIVGSDLHDVKLWVTVDNALIDLSSGYTFSCLVKDSTGSTTFTKSTGFTGAAGSGTESSGSPNLTIAWAAGDLGAIASEGRYIATVTGTQTGDSRNWKRRFVLQLVA